MAEALINPHILMWARERAGFGVAEIAEKLKIKPEQWLAWEHGEKNQALAKPKSSHRKPIFLLVACTLTSRPSKSLFCRTYAPLAISLLASSA